MNILKILANTTSRTYETQVNNSMDDMANTGKIIAIVFAVVFVITTITIIAGVIKSFKHIKNKNLTNLKSNIEMVEDNENKQSTKDNQNHPTKKMIKCLYCKTKFDSNKSKCPNCGATHDGENE